MLQQLSFRGSSYLAIPGPASRPVIVFVPGNPGIAQYYEDYITKVHELSGLECVVLSQLGSDLAVQDSGVFTLDDQIKHKVDFLNAVCPNRRVILLGHSIGAWMVQRVAVQSLECTIVFCGLLTPTIQDIAKSDRGRSLTWFKEQAGHWGVAALVKLLAGLGYLPWLVRAVLAVAQRNASRSVQQTTLALAQRPHILRQILVMGFEEMDRVDDQDLPEFWQRDYGIWLFYAEHDHWVLDSTRAATIERRAGANVQIDIAPVAHAFVMGQSELVAEKTVAAVGNLLGHAVGAPPTRSLTQP